MLQAVKRFKSTNCLHCIMEESNSKEFKPSFENGGFWEYYKDLERQFEEFLNYVPYFQKNENTVSFRLANLIVAIGSYVDSAFREIASYSDFVKKYPSILRTARGKIRTTRISDYYVLAEEYSLEDKEVEFKCLPERERIKPFAQYVRISGKVASPNWWQVYNGIKHHFRDNLENANLKNAKEALGGAFLLNAVHTPSALRLYDYGILKTRMPIEQSPGRFKKIGSARFQIKESLENRQQFIGDIETNLFRYDYWQ